ncbi:MAG: DnaD domain protein [Clostridia bacterium]|nr:DnaD domain protein [Clostridia bacterium]
MAFCSFDDSAALFDATPVENMFISEYMLRAPGDFVKVYLYGLMLCYHHSERMSLASMARDLDITQEDVERAYRYWEREGLVRRTGDNPVRYTYYNLKQITLTRAEKPSEQLYNRHFMDEVRRTLDAQTLNDPDYQTIMDWIQVYELPEEVVIMLLRSEKERSRTGRVSFKIATETAQRWAQSGVRTLEDAEQMLILSGEREKELKRLLARLGQHRPASEDEKNMYLKWIDEWGFTAEAVQEACRETTKGTPTMAYLDGILLRQHQLGRHDAAQLLGGIAQERTARDFAREVLAGLGRTGVTPTSDDLALIESWRRAGNSDELILLAVTAAHRRKDGGTMEIVGNWLEKWMRQGLTTPEAVTAHSNRQKALNSQLREIYDAAGMEKNTNQPDRDLLCSWMGEMAMSMELVLLAAQYARTSGAPMMTMNRILSDWHRAGIATLEAARAEHDSHVRGGGQAGGAPAARAQDTLLRYTPEERRKTYSAAVLDFDEEDS